jgi:hypothetical protein
VCCVCVQMKLPDSPPWWDLFGVRLKDIKRVCEAILSLYHQPKLSWLEPLDPTSFFSAQELEKVSGGPSDDSAAETPCPGGWSGPGPRLHIDQTRPTVCVFTSCMGIS